MHFQTFKEPKFDLLSSFSRSYVPRKQPEKDRDMGSKECTTQERWGGRSHRRGDGTRAMQQAWRPNKFRHQQRPDGPRRDSSRKKMQEGIMVHIQDTFRDFHIYQKALE